MNVRELISKLEGFDGDADVYLSVRGNAYDPSEVVSGIVRWVGKQSPYEVVEDDDEDNTGSTDVAVLIEY
jgi:hypothetical protein